MATLWQLVQEDRKNLATRQSNASLWKLENPHATCWRQAKPELSIWDGRSGLKRRPVLFVHGVEYAGPHEVLRDLVLPFERAARLNGQADRFEYLFVSWNSLLFEGPLRQKLEQSASARFALFGMGMLLWPAWLADVERRAEEAARTVAPLVEHLLDDHPLQRPVVITHSLGSWLWSKLISDLQQQGRIHAAPGPWWNMQAAVKRSAWCRGGEFEDIPALWSGPGSSPMTLWYSRFDFILSTLYLIAKPGMAAGQFGATNTRFHHRDVTKWAGEAHGQNKILSGPGAYFERVQHLIRQEAMTLGLT